MPDIRSDIAGLGNLQSERAGTEATRQEGVFNGSRVQVIDVNSLIADAAEELTSSLSEDTEKDVSQREIEGGRRSDSLKRLMKIQEVSDLLQKFSDMDKNALERTLKELLRQRNSARQLREKARERFKDAAHRYALLKALAHGLRERGADEGQIAAADEAIAQLMAEDGTQVRAALNIADTIDDFTLDDLGGTGELRQAYHDNIKDYSSMSAALNDLTERFGSEDLEKSIQFMTAALAADLSAVGPSMERSKLNVILDDMHRLKSLTTIKGRCDNVMRTARRQGARKDADGVWLLKELVPLQDAKWIKTQVIEKMPISVGLDDIERQIRFFNDLQEVVRTIPPKCFARAENRDKLMAAVRQVTEAAVRREEDEFEEDDDE